MENLVHVVVSAYYWSSLLKILLGGIGYVSTVLSGFLNWYVPDDLDPRSTEFWPRTGARRENLVFISIYFEVLITQDNYMDFEIETFSAMPLFNPQTKTVYQSGFV